MSKKTKNIIYACLLVVWIAIMACTLSTLTTSGLFRFCPVGNLFISIALFCVSQNALNAAGVIVMVCCLVMILIAVSMSLGHFKNRHFLIFMNIILGIDLLFNIFTLSIVALVLDLVFVLLGNMIRKQKYDDDTAEV